MGRANEEDFNELHGLVTNELIGRIKSGTAALEAAGLLNEDGEYITASHTHSLDVIGVITRGGEYDPETGDVVVAPTMLDGWHVNYVGNLPDGWDEFAVYPANPVRVWA